MIERNAHEKKRQRLQGQRNQSGQPEEALVGRHLQLMINGAKIAVAMIVVRIAVR
jgi:hypothetical protein